MTDQETRLVKATPQPDQPRTGPKKDKRRSQGDPLAKSVYTLLLGHR